MSNENNIVEIKGLELDMLERILNRQESHDIKNHFTASDLTILVNRNQYPSDFVSTLENKKLIRYNEGKVYATDLALRSLYNKYKKERQLINKHIVDDYEFAFLEFMHNRNEPVPMLHFPTEFLSHSKIHLQPVKGSPGLYRDWFDEVYKYVDESNIHGYILNDLGKSRFEKLKIEKELKEEKEIYEMQKLRTEVQHLTDIVVDYPKTKSNANKALTVAIIAAIGTVLGIIVQIVLSPSAPHK